MRTPCIPRLALFSLLLTLSHPCTAAARADTPAEADQTPPPLTPPQFMGPSVAVRTLGEPLVIKITAAGNPAPSIDEPTASADLKDSGLTFDPASGTLFGAPTTAKTYVLHFTAKNTPGKADLFFTLTVKKAPVATKPTPPCESNTHTVRLRALQDDDADGLAKILNSTFSQYVTVSAAAKPPAAPTSDTSSNDATTSGAAKAPAPKQFLCIYRNSANASTGKLQPLTGPAPPALSNLIDSFDRPEFAAVGLDGRFLVPLVHISADQLTDIAKAFPIPAPGLELGLPDPPIVVGEKRFLILRPAGTDLQLVTKTGSDLAAQAAKVRKDLLALDLQFFLVQRENISPPSLGADFDSLNAASTPEEVTRVRRELEAWDAQHTIAFAALDPRDVRIFLGNSQLFNCRTLQVLSRQRALSIRPEAVSPESDDAFRAGKAVASEILQRSLLYARSNVEQAWEQQLQKDALTAKSGAGTTTPQAPPITTTNATTTITTPVSTPPPASNPASDAATKSNPPTPAPIKVQTTTSTQTTTPSSPATQGSGSPGASGAPAAPNSAVASAAGSAAPTPPAPAGASATAPPVVLSAGTVVRLFHLRQATNIATIINSIPQGPGAAPLVQPMSDFGNDDLLMILPPAAGQLDNTQAVRRMIANLDEPRPNVNLQVWSYEISSERDIKSDDRHSLNERSIEVSDGYAAFKNRVQVADNNVQRALTVGLSTAINFAKTYPNFFDADFQQYLTNKSQSCVLSDRYCLGYESALAFGPLDAGNTNAVISFNRYIVLIAAASDSAAPRMIDATIQAMNGSACGLTTLCFPELERALEVIVQPYNHHLFRAALLDFLFQYKWSQAYPNDFDPYYLQRSAQTLDGYFSTLMSALNRDVDRYCEAEMQNSADQTIYKAKHVGLANNGEVQISMISGDPATISGTVNNYFDITPPVLLKDLVSGLAGGAGNSSQPAAPAAGTATTTTTTTTGAAASATPAAKAMASAAALLTPWQAVALNALATASAPPQLVAQVNAQTSLAVTPFSLDTASAAELKLNLQISNPTTTQDASKGASSSFIRQDLANSVANYNVQTEVRVDSFKLFQVSSLSLDLTHAQTSVPVPVVGWAYEAVFGTVPWMKDHLLAIPRHPQTIQNRSIAVVRAVVVPTAMDLGLSLPFRDDYLEDPYTSGLTQLSTRAQTNNKFQDFHKQLILCILQGYSDCMTQTRLSLTPQ